MAEMKKGPPAPVYLFLGSESYRRAVCRQALVKKALLETEREGGITRHDMDEVSLMEVIDDARSLSLFASHRLIWASSADSALPRGRGKSAASPAITALGDYLANPSPSVVLVLEASKWGFEGEGKKRLERVRKFYAAIPSRQVVEFAPYSPADAQRLAGQLARRAGVKIGPEELGLLGEAVGYDATRIATEIEKLALFVGADQQVAATDIAQLVPSARATTIFELVAALGRGDRTTALELLDTLVREGEYLPLALSFLGTQFRQALVVREMGLRDARQVLSFFQQSGVRLWFKKAQEIQQTARAFSAAELKAALARIHRADKGLRDARPDDRTIMEQFVLGLKKG